MTSRRSLPAATPMSPNPSARVPCWPRYASISHRRTRDARKEEPVRTPPRILIVDDQPMNVDILKTRIAVHGYELLTATDGAEALEVACAQQPDLILLDIMMPRIDGIEVCQRLKADTTLPFMPIIMVTAKADSKDIVAGLQAGGGEYLTQPGGQGSLVGRGQSMLRIKAPPGTAQEQTAPPGERARQ